MARKAARISLPEDGPGALKAGIIHVISLPHVARTPAPSARLTPARGRGTMLPRPRLTPRGVPPPGSCAQQTFFRRAGVACATSGRGSSEHRLGQALSGSTRKRLQGERVDWRLAC